MLKAPTEKGIQHNALISNISNDISGLQGLEEFTI